MPHYANGQEAKPGDLIQTVPPNPTQTRACGILVSISTGSDSCNGQMLPLARKYAGQESPWFPAIPFYCDCVTLKECLPLQLAPSEPPIAS